MPKMSQKCGAYILDNISIMFKYCLVTDKRPSQKESWSHQSISIAVKDK